MQYSKSTNYILLIWIISSILQSQSPIQEEEEKRGKEKRDITFTLCFMTALQKYLDMIACNSDNKNKGQPGDVVK